MTMVQQNNGRINHQSLNGTTRPLDFIRRADACIKRGWVPIPTCWPTPEGACGCGGGHTGHHIGKDPLIANWNAVTLYYAKGTIQEWAKHWPWANVAILVEASGLIFVGPDSAQASGDWQALGLPPTTIRFSHNNGYLYKRPDGCALARSCKPTYGDVVSSGLAVVSGAHALGDEVYTDGDEPTDAPAWVVELLASSEAEPIERPVTEGKGAEPPVRLRNDEAQGLWDGSLVVNRAGIIVPSERADIDRSNTLYRIGAALANFGATRSTIADALAERDETLDYRKFSDRKDDGENEYLRIAEKTVAPLEQVYSSSARAAKSLSVNVHATVRCGYYYITAGGAVAWTEVLYWMCQMGFACQMICGHCFDRFCPMIHLACVAAGQGLIQGGSPMRSSLFSEQVRNGNLCQLAFAQAAPLISGSRNGSVRACLLGCGHYA